MGLHMQAFVSMIYIPFFFFHRPILDKDSIQRHDVLKFNIKRKRKEDGRKR